MQEQSACKRHPLEPHLGHLRARPKPTIAVDAGGARRVCQPVEIWRVAIDDRRAARLDAEEDLRLGIGDLGERGEMSEMARARSS